MRATLRPQIATSGNRSARPWPRRGQWILKRGPAGRPARTTSPEGERIHDLEQELHEKDLELRATEVRLEIAQTMPQLIEDEAVKKTTHRKQRKRQLQQRQYLRMPAMPLQLRQKKKIGQPSMILVIFMICFQALRKCRKALL